MIRFACECGRQLQAREEDIGKRIAEIRRKEIERILNGGK